MAPRGEVWRLGHRPALDGVRGIAILLVVAHHGLPEIFPAGGTVGVTLFFALSGFLISAILLEERESTGRLDLRRFYARRARRLLPALVVLVALAVVLGLVFSSRIATVGSAVPVLMYVANLPLAAGARVDALGHTWSLAIEEQFYLVWPLVLLAIPIRRRFTFGVVLAAGVGVAAWRAALWLGGASDARVYYGTDTRSDALLIGCAVALFVSGRAPWKSHRWVVPVAVLSMAATGLLGTDVGLYVAAPTVAVVLAAAMVIGAAGEHPPVFLSSTLLRWCGRRSYGLYLWHAPVFYFGLRAFHYSWLSVTISLVISVVLTWASWRYVEEPVMRRAQRSMRPAASVAAEPRTSPLTGPLGVEAVPATRQA
jgi:peptidoglycan/LPS O-acetylase OafA/YrhL